MLQALLAAAVLAAAAALAGVLPPLHGWGSAGSGGGARAVFPQSPAQAWHGEGFAPFAPIAPMMRLRNVTGTQTAAE